MGSLTLALVNKGVYDVYTLVFVVPEYFEILGKIVMNYSVELSLGIKYIHIRFIKYAVKSIYCMMYCK